MRSFTFVLAAALVAACARAGGDATGGELTPAGEQAETPEPFNPPTIEVDCPGATWSELYKNTFGPTGKPGSCVFRSECHAAGSDARTAGILCADEKECFQSWSPAAPQSPATEKHFGQSLLGTIRHRKADGTPTGFMPKAPGNVFFTASCMDNLAAWFANGSPP